jgi:hypothetical protein
VVVVAVGRRKFVDIYGKKCECRSTSRDADNDTVMHVFV